MKSVMLYGNYAIRANELELFDSTVTDVSIILDKEPESVEWITSPYVMADNFVVDGRTIGCHLTTNKYGGYNWLVARVTFPDSTIQSIRANIEVIGI